MAGGTGWGIVIFGAGVVVGARGIPFVGTSAAPVPGVIRPYTEAVGTAWQMSGVGEARPLDPVVVLLTVLVGLLAALVIAIMIVTSRQHGVHRTSRHGTLLADGPSTGSGPRARRWRRDPRSGRWE